MIYMFFPNLTVNLSGGYVRRCDSQPHGPTITIHKCLHVEKQSCTFDVEEETPVTCTCTCNVESEGTRRSSSEGGTKRDVRWKIE